MGLLRGAAIVAASAVALTTPASGGWGGLTSQPATAGSVSFRVSGSSITSEVISWDARCRSGHHLIAGTQVRGLPIVHGGWSDTGSYQTTYPKHVTADVRIVQNTAQFTSPITAVGVWHANATIRRHGRKIDACGTGIVRWVAGTFASGAASSLVVPPDTPVGGLGYPRWLTKAWQWDIADLRLLAGTAPSTAPCVRAGQRPPVWFLDPNEWNAGLPFTVRCKVPAGEYLFLDTPSTECSNKEARPFYAKTAAGLVRCARRLGATRSSLVIDGQVASPSGVTAATNPFRFTSPARHNILAAPGVRSGLAAAYGQGLMLYPLSPGVHTLERVYQYAGGGIRVLTFVVTVP